MRVLSRYLYLLLPIAYFALTVKILFFGGETAVLNDFVETIKQMRQIGDTPTPTCDRNDKLRLAEISVIVLITYFVPLAMVRVTNIFVRNKYKYYYNDIERIGAVRFNNITIFISNILLISVLSVISHTAIMNCLIR